MSDRPDILFVFTDQQHAGLLSCAGDGWLRTPALDRLAAGGIRFARAWCANPVCGPSRTAMATGVMPNRLGADTNPHSDAITVPPALRAASVGHLMRRAGYATFYGGKIHLCADLDPRRDAGYDAYRPDERDGLPGACLDFLRRHDGPCFAVASFINPHDICFAHRARGGRDTQGVLALYEEAAALPDDALPPLPANHPIQEGEAPSIQAHLSTTDCTPPGIMRADYDGRDWRINRWIYRRLAERVDARLGELLDGLEALGRAADTLVVFTSDHGNMDGAHRLASKGTFFEESVGVPLLLRLPGSIPAGVTDRAHLVSTGLDLLPTFCDYAGIAPPAHCLGASLRPLAEGATEVPWRSFVPAENEWFRALRTDRYKYAVSHPPACEETLVDLAEDPGEACNRAGDPALAGVLAEHRRLLADWVERSGDETGRRFLVGDG